MTRSAAACIRPVDPLAQIHCASVFWGSPPSIPSCRADCTALLRAYDSAVLQPGWFFLTIAKESKLRTRSAPHSSGFFFNLEEETTA